MSDIEHKPAIDHIEHSSAGPDISPQPGSTLEVTDPKATKYGTTWVAWVQLLVLIGVNCSCAIMWMSASSSPTAMSTWMGSTLTQLNWLSNTSAICNTVISLITAWCYERLGIKLSVIICAVLNAVGCWVRCIAILLPQNKRYGVMVTGQLIASLGGPLVYNIAAKMVAVWFAPRDRGIANTLITIQLGMAVAPIMMPPLASTADQTPRMLVIVAGIATAAALPTPFLPSKPKIPPSASAEVERMPFWLGAKHLMRNWNFWCITWLAAVNIGMVYSVSVLIMEAISPYGYTDQEAGICAAVVVVGGFAGGAMTGYWLGRTAQHLMLIKLFTPMIVFTYVAFIFEIIPNAFGVVVLACILNGFFSYALFPVYLEFASEVSYPVPESIGTCIIWSSTTTAMLIFSVIIDALRAGPDANPPYNMQTSMITVAVIVAVGSLPCIFLKGDLHRLAVDLRETSKETMSPDC